LTHCRSGVAALLDPAYILRCWFAPVVIFGTLWSDTAPIDVVLAEPNELMKRGPRPVDKLMLARVPVNVVGTSFEVVFVTNGMLPETWLPDSSFATFTVRFLNGGLRKIGRESLIAELSLDLFHS
jgi:hypothetical protein